MADASPNMDACAMDNSDAKFGLRIGAIFIILATSLIGTLLPIILRKASFVPRSVFEFAKFFGSGVIIATAFIHLLAPAFEELGSECLSGTWTEYDWAPAIAMASIFGIFFAEVAAYRLGTAKLAKLHINYSSHGDNTDDAHGHDHPHPHGGEHGNPATPAAVTDDHTSHSHSDSDLEAGRNDAEKAAVADMDNESLHDVPTGAEAATQLIAVGVLEFGVILHSIIIGLTLAVTDEFDILFIVIIFHQMFEGLGLGSRLTGLHLPEHLWWARWVAAAVYSICTPIGMAAGLGARQSYNGNGEAAMITSGVLDAISAGILLYTGLVELLAHEILFNPRAMKMSNGRMAFIFCCMLLGAGLMALLGRWA